MRICLCLFVFLLFGSCSTGPKTAGSENVERTEIDQLQQTREADLYPEERKDPAGKEPIYRRIRMGIYVYESGIEDIDWTYVPRRIDFFDSVGTQLSSFDIEKNNPYTRNQVPTLEDENYQWIDASIAYLDRTKKGHNSVDTVAVHHRAYIQLSHRSSLPVVGYHLIGLNRSYQAVSWHFSAVCLDEKGNVIARLENLPIDPVDFALSEDERYFCVTYGGLRGEELTRLNKSGMQLYSLLDNRLVYSDTADELHRFAGPSIYPRINFVGFSLIGNDFNRSDEAHLIFVDSATGELFTRQFSKEERIGLREITETGILIQDKKERRKNLISFKGEFKMEKINN